MDPDVIFFCVARGRLLRVQVPAPPVVPAAHGEGVFCVMESVTIGSGRRRVEGRCLRWSPSRLRSAADGGVWRVWGFCRDRWSIYGAKKSPDHAGDRETARSGFCQAVRSLAIMPSLLSHLLSCLKCKLQIQNCWIPHFMIFDKLQEYKPQMQNCWRCSSTSV